MTVSELKGMDILGVEHGVEIEVQERHNHKVVYVHVDGVTVVRIRVKLSETPMITLRDDGNHVVRIKD